MCDTPASSPPSSSQSAYQHHRRNMSTCHRSVRLTSSCIIIITTIIIIITFAVHHHRHHQLIVRWKLSQSKRRKTVWCRSHAVDILALRGERSVGISTFGIMGVILLLLVLSGGATAARYCVACERRHAPPQLGQCGGSSYLPRGLRALGPYGPAGACPPRLLRIAQAPGGRGRD